MQNNTRIDFVQPLFCLPFKNKQKTNHQKHTQSKHDAKSVQMTAFLSKWQSWVNVCNIWPGSESSNSDAHCYKLQLGPHLSHTWKGVNASATHFTRVTMVIRRPLESMGNPHLALRSNQLSLPQNQKTFSNPDLWFQFCAFPQSFPFWHLNLGKYRSKANLLLVQATLTSQVSESQISTLP